MHINPTPDYQYNPDPFNLKKACQQIPKMKEDIPVQRFMIALIVVLTLAAILKTL